MPNSTSQTGTIYQQIETDAGYYPPSVYDLLTRYDTLATGSDPEAQNYIPYTSAMQGAASQASASKFLPFIVGVLPPFAPTTQLLDPSATVGALVGAPVGIASSQAGGQGVGPGGSRGADGRNNGGPPTYYPMSALQRANGILGAYRAQNGGADPSVSLLQMMTAQSLFEQPEPPYGDGKGLPDFNYGGVGFRSTPKPNTFYAPSKADVPGYYSSYLTATSGAQPYVATIRSHPQALTAGDAGDPTGYVNGLLVGGPGAYFTGDPTVYINSVNTNYQALQGTLTSIAQVAAATPPTVSNLVAESPGNGATYTGTNPPNWNSTGAPASQSSKQQQSVVSGTLLKAQSDTTQALLSAQQSQLNATNLAIQQMAATPPLQMLVSPTSFKVNAEKVVADGSWGRNGPIVEHWGNQQEKIEGSGKLAAFYALDNKQSQTALAPGATNDGPGLTRMARSFSLSYQNFLSLYLIYKNNGGIYLNDSWATQSASATPTSINKMNLSMVGSVYIYYDSCLYLGSFDSFTITETDTAPFTLEYSFSFTVRAWFLLDRTMDPRLVPGASPPDTSIPGVLPANEAIANNVAAFNSTTKGFV